MCGIVVLFRAGGAREMEPMLRVISHRGPDDDGIIECGDTILGARRLSIIDLPGGHQPLANEQRTVWVAYNGEIYNHAALREQLKAAGHRFATNTDTEVLVHGYEQWGIDGLLQRLRGMFAFALADMRAGTCILVRDRLGKKPLYLARVGAGWAAASEIKSLFLHPGIAPEIDQSRIPESLANRFVTNGRTLFANVTRLLPGHYMVIEPGRAETRCYWSPPEGGERTAGRDIPAEVRARVDEAVKLRLIADVPLGTLLSGGIDSSVIAAAMRRAGANPLRTYTVGFEPAEGDERAAARVVAEHLHTEHTERVVTLDAARQLDDVVWHADEPLGDAAALPTMLICRAAREHVKVVLSGEGADELFLGYPRYLLVRLAERARGLPAALRKPLLGAGAALLGGRARRALERLAEAPQDALVRSAMWMSGSRPETISALCRIPALDWERWYVPESGGRGAEGQRGREAEGQWGREAEGQRGRGAGNRIGDVIRRDLSAWLVDDILLKLDKMSMAASLEARAPFLDHELVEFVCRLDIEARFAARGKRWLRQAYAADLPAPTRTRAKHPFRVPVAGWLRGALGLELEAAIGRPSGFTASFLDKGVARSLLEEHRRGADHSLLLWNLLVHEAWWRRFFAGPGVAA